MDFGIIIIFLAWGSAIGFHQGVIFEQEGDALLTDSYWTIALQYNLSQVAEENQNLSKTLVKVKGQYDKFFEDLLNQNSSIHSPLQDLEVGFRYEYASLQQLVSEYIDKTSDLITLLPHHRQKRGLVDAGGHALKFLFGTVVSSDLESINSRLDSISSVTDEITHNSKEQLTVLNNMQTEISTHSRTINNIVLTLKEYHRVMQASMNHHFERETIALNQLKTLFRYLKLNTALSELKDTVNLAAQRMSRFHQAVEDLAAGRMSSNLLPPHQYLKVLKTVEKVVPPPAKLFVDVNLETLNQFYKAAIVKSFTSETQLKVLIKLPLKSDTQVYDIFNVITYPVYDHSLNRWVQWVLENQKLMISKDRQTYSVYTSGSLAPGCILGKLTVCPLTNVLLNPYKRPNCVTQLLLSEKVTLCTRKLIVGLESPVLIRTNSRWLYSTSKEEKLIVNCYGPDSTLNVSTIVLNGVGEIPNRDRCDLVADGYRVPARFIGSTWYPGNFGRVTFPEINNIFNQSETSLMKDNLNETLRVLAGLDDQLGTTSVREYSLESALRHLESHYQTQALVKNIIVVTGLGVLIIIVVFVLFRWRVRVVELIRAIPRRSTEPQRAARADAAPTTSTGRFPRPNNSYMTYDSPGLGLSALA